MRASDLRLVAELKEMAKDERTQVVRLLERLGEMDGRRLYGELGFASLWAFCREELLFSESVTGKRIAVARAMVAMPRLRELLVTGRLSVCSAALLAPHVGGDGGEALVEEACGMSKRELSDLLARRKGVKAKRRDTIRRVVEELEAEPVFVMAGETLTLARETSAGASVAAKVEAKTHNVSFAASTRLVENLDKLKELLGGEDLDGVLLRATEALLDKVDPVRRHARREKAKAAKAKAAAGKAANNTADESAARPAAGLLPLGAVASRREPRFFRQADRDAGYVRDGGRCTYVSPLDGRRCAARAFIQHDHVRAWALGGRSSLSNHRLLCSCHNQLMARKTFGNRPATGSTRSIRTH